MLIKKKKILDVSIIPGSMPYCFALWNLKTSSNTVQVYPSLWDHHPRLPLKDDLVLIREQQMYRFAIDEGWHLQHMIWEFDGWHQWTMAELQDAEPYNAKLYL
jgi:hypothetical protein